MRLVLSCRGWDIVDLELLLFRRRVFESECVVTSTSLECSEISEDIEPETWAFGFQRP